MTGDSWPSGSSEIICLLGTSAAILHSQARAASEMAAGAFCALGYVAEMNQRTGCGCCVRLKFAGRACLRPSWPGAPAATPPVSVGTAGE
jgi:hypothetical protein